MGRSYKKGGKKSGGKKSPPDDQTATTEEPPNEALKNQDGEPINQVKSQVSATPKDPQDKPADLADAISALQKEPTASLKNQAEAPIDQVKAPVSVSSKKTPSKPSSPTGTVTVLQGSSEAGVPLTSLFGIGGAPIKTKKGDGGNRTPSIVPGTLQGGTQDNKAGDGGNRTLSIVPGTLQGDTQDTMDTKVDAAGLLQELSFFGSGNDNVTKSTPVPKGKEDGSTRTATRDPKESHEEQGGNKASPTGHNVADTSDEQGGSNSPSKLNFLLSKQTHDKRQEPHGRSDHQDGEESITKSLVDNLEGIKDDTNKLGKGNASSGGNRYKSPSQSIDSNEVTPAVSTQLLHQDGFQNQQEEEIFFEPVTTDDADLQYNITITHDDIEYAPDDILTELYRINSTVTDGTTNEMVTRICRKISEAQSAYEATHTSTGTISMANMSTNAEMLRINMAAGIELIDHYTKTTKRQGERQDDNPPDPPYPDDDDSCVGYLTSTMMGYISYLDNTEDDFSVGLQPGIFGATYQGANLITWRKLAEAAESYIRSTDRQFRDDFPMQVVNFIMDWVPYDSMNPYEIMNHLLIAYAAGYLCVPVGIIYQRAKAQVPRQPWHD